MQWPFHNANHLLWCLKWPELLIAIHCWIWIENRFNKYKNTSFLLRSITDDCRIFRYVIWDYYSLEIGIERVPKVLTLPIFAIFRIIRKLLGTIKIYHITVSSYYWMWHSLWYHNILIQPHMQLFWNNNFGRYYLKLIAKKLNISQKTRWKALR